MRPALRHYLSWLHLAPRNYRYVLLKDQIRRFRKRNFGLDGFHFHDLRHTYAGFLIAEGAHPRALMERLGHSTINVTLGTYGHLLPSLEQDLTDRLDVTLAATKNRGSLHVYCTPPASDRYSKLRYPL